jgi:hypothetical protein
MGDVKGLGRQNQQFFRIFLNSLKESKADLTPYLTMQKETTTCYFLIQQAL